jgi:hypothetical protein
MASRFVCNLQVNEFHHAPTDFFFTSPLNDTVLPTLRVSGDGVLREFGFNTGAQATDLGMVVLIGALQFSWFRGGVGNQVCRSLAWGTAVFYLGQGEPFGSSEWVSFRF